MLIRSIPFSVIQVSLVILFFGCSEHKNESQVSLISDDYKEEIADYWNSVFENRKEHYLPIVALFQLDSTLMAFGSSPNAYLHLKKPSAPEFLGTFMKKDSSVKFISARGVEIRDSKDSIIEKAVLVKDSFGNSQSLNCNKIEWQLITRNDKPYLRVWDFENKEINDFKGFESYSLNPNMIFEGTFNYFQDKKSEKVDSQLGPKTAVDFIGRLTFRYHQKEYSLDVSENGFLMVSDASSGSQTYGGGRYMYLNLPKKDSLVLLDFNKLYNPPCSFNEFTTCLYPPRQNDLPFKIEAGERIDRK